MMLLRFLLILLLLTGAFQHLSAAEIQIVTKAVDQSYGFAPCNIRLTGNIEIGDARKLAEAASKLEGAGYYKPRLCLASEGGNFEETIRIVEMMLGFLLPQSSNDLELVTEIEAGDKCLSACAFIFMAGMECSGTGVICTPSRYLHVKGTLGFHAPFLTADLPSDSNTLRAAYGTAMRQMARLTEVFSQTDPRVNQGAKSWIRPTLFAELLKREPKDFYFIDTVAKAGFYEISLFGEGEISSPSKSMMYHACSNLNYWNSGHLNNYNVVKRLQESGDMPIKNAKIVQRVENGVVFTELSQFGNYKTGMWSKCEFYGKPFVLEPDQAGMAGINVDGTSYSNLVWVYFPGNTPIRRLSEPNLLNQAQSR